jgi:hypothetical protein
MTHTSLARYTPWMARDYVFWGGVATFVLLFGFGWLSWAPLSIMIARAGPEADPQIVARGIRSLASVLVGTLGFLGPLIATLGIVSGDRHHGYYRFIFSRPVSPSRYYATVFAVNGAGFMLVAGLLWGIFAVAIAPIDVRNFLPIMALSYLFIGGLMFLISVLSRFDLAIGVPLYVMSAMAWGTLEGGAVAWVQKVRLLVWLLPPVSRHASLLGSVTRLDVGISGKQVLWVAGYGLICFTLGLAILRRRGFAE